MVSSAFLHAGWEHLLGNMFFLLFFGRKVEDLLGPAKFLLLYFVCIYTSNLGSVIGEVALPLWRGSIRIWAPAALSWASVGAYLFLYYEERIRTLPMILGFIPFIFWRPRFAGVGVHSVHHIKRRAQRLAGRANAEGGHAIIVS